VQPSLRVACRRLQHPAIPSLLQWRQLPYVTSRSHATRRSNLMFPLLHSTPKAPARPAPLYFALRCSRCWFTAKASPVSRAWVRVKSATSTPPPHFLSPFEQESAMGCLLTAQPSDRARRWDTTPLVSPLPPHFCSIRWVEKILASYPCLLSSSGAQRSHHLTGVPTASAAVAPFTVRVALLGLAAPKIPLAPRLDAEHRQPP
jgi:hypothetical protein